MSDLPSCNLSFLDDIDAKSIDIDPSDDSKRFFIVKRHNEIFAYRNVCPHTRAPLNWQADNFLSLGKDYIQCSLHGAMFRIEDGFCVAGPCARRYLTSVPFEIIDGDIILRVE